jgi:nucleoside-diphosphate-sugar epimerase
MKKKILVTGGLGFIGKAITKSLLLKGHKVIVVDNNFRNKKNHIRHKNLKIFNIDIRNKEGLKKISKKIDSVIHLAFINGTNFFYEKSELVLDVGVKGILNILDICRENKIKEFFLASSSEVYQEAPYFPTDEKVRLIIPNPHDPRFSYSTGKIVSEILLLNASHFDKTVIFRPHNIYGPDMGYNHVIPELTKKSISSKNILKIQGNGKNKRSFCYIDDFVQAFNLIFEKGKNKEIYNIGTSEEINILKLAKLINSIVGKKMIIKNSKKVFYNASRRLPEIKKIKKLGYKPKFSLSEGLIITVNWYKEDYDK